MMEQWARYLFCFVRSSEKHAGLGRDVGGEVVDVNRTTGFGLGLAELLLRLRMDPGREKEESFLTQVQND